MPLAQRFASLTPFLQHWVSSLPGAPPPDPCLSNNCCMLSSCACVPYPQPMPTHHIYITETVQILFCCLILSHVHSQLSAQSTRSLLCLGNWSLHGFIKDIDVETTAQLTKRSLKMDGTQYYCRFN